MMLREILSKFKRPCKECASLELKYESLKVSIKKLKRELNKANASRNYYVTKAQQNKDDRAEHFALLERNNGILRLDVHNAKRKLDIAREEYEQSNLCKSIEYANKQLQEERAARIEAELKLQAALEVAENSVKKKQLRPPLKKPSATAKKRAKK